MVTYNDFEEHKWDFVDNYLRIQLSCFAVSFKSEEYRSVYYDNHIEVKNIFGMKYAVIYVYGDDWASTSGYTER
jgi:hypothetical protein